MPAKHANDLKETYANIADRFEARNTPDAVNPQLINNREIFAKNLPIPANILDLGAGNGRDSEFLSSYGHHVTLFDISQEMLAIAKTRVPNGTFVAGDMTDLEFSPATFDGIWSSLSLLHLTKLEIKSVLKNLFKILKPNGYLYVLMRKGKGEEVENSNKYGVKTQRFFSLFSVTELEKNIIDAGFKIKNSGELSSGKSKKEQVFVLARKE